MPLICHEIILVLGEEEKGEEREEEEGEVEV